MPRPSQRQLMVDLHAKLMLRLDRAAEHLETLKAEFEWTNPNDFVSIVGDKDAETGRKIIRLRLLQQPPPRLGLLAGETAYQVRATLNNLVAGLLEARRIKVTRDHEFPIIPDERQWTDANVQKWLGGLNKRRIARIRRYQPFLAKDKDRHPLRALARLTNLDKHHAVPPVLTLLGRAEIEVHRRDSETTVTDFRGIDPKYPRTLHDGAEICSFRTLPDSDRTVDVKWVGEFPLGFGTPIPATAIDLSRLIGAVHRIVDEMAS